MQNQPVVVAYGTTDANPPFCFVHEDASPASGLRLAVGAAVNVTACNFT